MADQKVSDLPSLNGADVDPADLLYIVDSSAGTAGSKKITVGQYQLAPVSGGTANGVTYLDGSKVLTSGSALTFDGTNFATTGTATATKLVPTGNVTAGNGMYLPAANTLAWSTNGAEGMRLDASGNLGLGVTPSAWSGTTSVFQNPSGAVYSFSSNSQNGINSNAYYNGTNWVYRNSTPASDYFLQNGQHIWRVAPSGTAGNAITFTQAMTLDASGNLAVGGITSTSAAFSQTTTKTTFSITPSNSNAGGTTITNSWVAGGQGPLIFADASGERARITSAGDFITNVNGTAPSLSTNSTMSFELTSNTSLKIVVRGTDGVTRSATLTLA